MKLGSVHKFLVHDSFRDNLSLQITKNTIYLDTTLRINLYISIADRNKFLLNLVV